MRALELCGRQDDQHVKGESRGPGALVDALVFGADRDVIAGRVPAGYEGRLDAGQVTHIAGQGGAAQAVVGEGRVVGVGEQGDADGAGVVAQPFGEVARGSGGVAEDHGLRQGLSRGAVPGQERHGGQPGLGREVGRDSGLDDVPDALGAHFLCPDW